MMGHMTLTEKIAYLRLRRTVEELAKTVGAKPRQVFRWAAGKNTPLPVFLRQIDQLVESDQKTAALHQELVPLSA